ncbi:ATP-binding protein [Fulvivirga lutimaris]|uniref:ATP-binding protein n=1 Tax=Fulvivirga lutimaris TaxID=1819566 RepID=UPI0012BCD501|nr:ATP-binding protein [Fulvivirga lutimaris]MTI40764.1 ATP-binding protein [Fulvivirga lutimaris]
MNKELKPYHSAVKKIIEKDLIDVVYQRLDQQKELVETAKKKLKSINGKNAKDEKNLKAYADYKADMMDITSALSKSILPDLNTEFQTFNKAFDHYLGSLPERISKEQLEERFKTQPTDHWRLKFLKAFKRTNFWISKRPQHFSNWVRKLRKKPVVPVQYWSHDIHVQDLVRYFLRARFLLSLKTVIDKYYQSVTATGLAIWEEDVQIDKCYAVHIHDAEKDAPSGDKKNDLNKIGGLIDEAKTSIAELVNKAFEDSWIDFESSYTKAGTIEFPKRKYSKRRTNKNLKRTLKQYNSTNRGWSNTVNGLTDDWEIDLELYQLMFEGFHEYHSVKAKINKAVSTNIFDQLKGVRAFLETSCEAIKSNKASLQSALEKELAAINKDLKAVTSSANDFILDQELAEIVNSIEAKIVNALENVSTKRAIIKGSDFTTASRSSQVSFISPNELINYECAPKLIKVTTAVKFNIMGLIQQAQDALGQIVDVAAFNVSSALSVLNDEKDNEKSKTIAVEGLGRSIDQFEKIKSNLESIETELSETLLPGIKTFGVDLVKFTNNENILELRMRIAKGKAAEKGKELKLLIINTIKNFIPILVDKTVKLYRKAEGYIKTNFKRFGIVSSQEAITTELADFLAESEKSIAALPFVYQRLFRVAALEDANFFEGRSVEINKLNKAYNQWMQGRFSATILTGEKGAGITSLLNLFLKDLGSSKEIVRMVSVNNISTETEFYGAFDKSLGSKGFDFDKLVNFLNEGPKRIIVIENLQKLYLKKVGGFKNIKLLTELISLTRDSVHWIVGCTQYAYNYLEKTISISDHFSYNIRLEDLSSEEIVKMIEKRHRVSGYNLIFEPRAEDLKNKKYKGLNEKGKQEYLKEEFFTHLNKIAKSNISIALIYWLRSTKHTSDNAIEIGSISSMDFSFLKTLSNQKLFLLTMLLLNDGMTEDELILATNYSVQKNRSIIYPLFEDGVVIKKDGVFYINPLLYRQSVNLLMSKNIVH